MTEAKVYTESRAVNDWLVGGGPSPRRAYHDEYDDRFDWMGLSNGQVDETINATDFLRNYLMGDILGCLLVLFFAALVVVPFIKYFFPKIAPGE